MVEQLGTPGEDMYCPQAFLKIPGSRTIFFPLSIPLRCNGGDACPLLCSTGAGSQLTGTAGRCCRSYSAGRVSSLSRGARRGVSAGCPAQRRGLKHRDVAAVFTTLHGTIVLLQ